MIGIKEAAAKLGLQRRRLQTLCAEGRVPGAERLGARAWMLPDAPEVLPPASGKLRPSKYPRQTED